MRKILLSVLAVIVALAGVWWYVSPRAASAPVTLTMTCGVNTADFELCQALAHRFEQQSNHRVEVKQAPADNATLHLGLLQELMLTRSDGVDVFMIDVIWPGMLAEQLLDLSRYFSPDDLADFFPRIVENNTVNGKLVGIPLFSDAGLFYYRRDLLQKYGFAGPPGTWDELEWMAQVIQEGERAEGHEDFWGYAWHGAQNEGLTCTALELLVSHGAGTVVAPDGTISVNNPAAVRAMERAANWIGTISPPETVSMGGGGVRTMLASGKAAFARDWPVAYRVAHAEESPVKGLVGVAVLPTSGGPAAATLGGWQLAVNKHSKQPQAAVELVRFLAGAEAQKVRAVEGALIPTRRSLYHDPEVLATHPFFGDIPMMLEAAVARPSTVTADRYNEASTAFSTAVNNILAGRSEARTALAGLESTLQAIKGERW